MGSLKRVRDRESCAVQALSGQVGGSSIHSCVKPCAAVNMALVWLCLVQDGTIGQLRSALEVAQRERDQYDLRGVWVVITCHVCCLCGQVSS